MNFEWTGSKIVEQESSEVLCDNSTGCKEADDRRVARRRPGSFGFTDVRNSLLFVNNKDADQPAHPRSLISDSVIR